MNGAQLGSFARRTERRDSGYGLRPGEKLYEELLIGENVGTTRHPMIRRAQETMLEALLVRHVDGFEPNGTLVDWLHGIEEGSATESKVLPAEPRPHPIENLG